MSGFKPFENITRKIVNSYYHLLFKNNDDKFIELNLTGNHLIQVNDKYVKTAYLKLNTVIQNYTLVEKQRIRKKVSVYDITNVKDTNSFITNGLNVHNCETAFINSVFPVVSSSKNSQIIIVSTPNGMNNEFYRIWNKAKLNISASDDIKWTPVEINWYDVPR